MLKKIGAFFVGLTTIAVLIAGAFLWDSWDDIEPKIHYFWGPYKSELKTDVGLSIALKKNVANCTENQELRRLEQLNLLRVNGTCTVELTEYSKQWEGKCPTIDSEKFHCVLIKIFTNPIAYQKSRHGDFVEATLDVEGKWTPWITADRKFFPNDPSIATAKTAEELKALVEKLDTYLWTRIFIEYQYNGQSRWNPISATDINSHDPFHGIPSF